MLNPWYITGFSEGEATFTYSRHGKGLGLYFAIKIIAKDSKIIYQIRDFFGVGRIYDVRPRLPRRYSGFTKQAVYYRVTKISDLERIVQHFDKYPLIGKKQASYQIWKKMFLLKQNFRKPDFDRLQELALALSDVTTKSTATKKKFLNANSKYKL